MTLAQQKTPCNREPGREREAEKNKMTELVVECSGKGRRKREQIHIDRKRNHNREPFKFQITPQRTPAQGERK